MKRTSTLAVWTKGLAAASVAALCCDGALAQFKYCQPWNQRRDSHTSRVVSCPEIPRPSPRLALDDFVIDDCEDVVLNRLTFWGVLVSPDGGDPGEQPDLPDFRIAFYADIEAECHPEQLLYEACVRPRARRVGLDCRQQPVFRFSTRIPSGFVGVTGQRYWLSIAVDGENQDNLRFQWSGHVGVKNCPAMQRDDLGNIFQPLLSTCDDCPNDLAFCIYERRLIGTLNPAFPEIGILKIRDRPTQVLLCESTVETYPDGHFEADAEVEGGEYLVDLKIPGELRTRRTVMINANSDTNMGVVQRRPGDLNDDNVVNNIDLGALLANYLLSAL